MISNEYTLLSSLVESSATVRGQLTQVQQQVASGKISETYAGLGNQARTSLDLRPAISHYGVWQSNINAAPGRLDVTQSALSSISSIAADFFARSNSIDTTDAIAVGGIATQARAALQQVAGLLNSKSGDLYVFAGTDTNNPPVPNTDPAVVGSSVLASDTARAPFSTTLTGTVTQIEVGEGQFVHVGVLANANSLAVSQAPTTGSYMRDTLKALASLAGLTTGTGAAATAASARGYLNSAISAMATETGALGQTAKSLTQRQTGLAQISTALTTQLSSVEDVDLAAAITKASALQTQLQASYQIIAQSKSLSLANFL